MNVDKLCADCKVKIQSQLEKRFKNLAKMNKAAAVKKLLGAQEDILKIFRREACDDCHKTIMREARK